MSITRKNKTHRRAKKKVPALVVVTKTYHPIEEALFPEKNKKAKEMLENSDFNPS
jgi:hypothetical protein